MQRLADALPALFEKTWTSAGGDVFCRLSASIVVVHLVAHELHSGTQTRTVSCGPICQELCLRRSRTTALQKSDLRDTVFCFRGGMEGGGGAHMVETCAFLHLLI